MGINWRYDMHTTSKKAKKQRKFRFGSKLHIRHRLVHTHLSKELKIKYKARAVPLRKGDKVKIMAGQFRNKTGKVSKVSLKKMKACIEGIELAKRDGSKAPYPIHPSNLMILELNTDDKLRRQKLESKAGRQAG